MTKEQFSSHMQLITSIFGTSEYNPDRMKFIFDAVKDLPEKNFAFIVRHFCKSKSVKYPPLPNEFEEAALEQRKRLMEYKTEDAFQSMEERGPERLKEILDQLGAKNVIDAMNKFKSKPEGA